MVRSISLKWRAVFGVMVLTITVLLLVGLVQMHFMRADLARVLADQQFALVSRVASDLDSKFETYQDVLVRSAAAFPRELLASPAGARAYYAARPAMLAAFDDLIVVRPDGSVVADYPEVPGRAGITAAGRPYFAKLLATRKPVIAEPVLSRARNEPVAQIAVPMLDGKGNIVGALVAVLRLYKNNFLADLANARVGKSGYFVIITKEAQPRYVIHPDKSKILRPRPAGATASVTQALQGFEGTIEDAAVTGQRMLYSYKSLGSVEWLLVAAVPTAEAYSPIVGAERRLLLICLVVALLVAPLVWSLAWLILRPVARLRDEMDKLRDAGAGYQPVPVERRDEIGGLTRSFNALMRERAEAEARQRGSEGRLRTIADNLPALIAYVNAEMRYEFVNRTFAVWFGRADEAHYLGRTMREVVGEAAWAEVVGAMSARALAGETVSYQRTMHEGGEARDIEITLVPDPCPNGKVAGLYVLINDITVLKRTKDQLREFNAALEQRVLERTSALENANRELETFAYSVAHDFRAPLRAMDGYSAILLEEQGPRLDEQGREQLARIRASSVRLGKLIDDLLRLAQLAQADLHREPVDLSSLAAQVVAELSAAQPQRNVEVVIAPGMRVDGDRAQLTALLRELLGNAWKFSAAKPDSAAHIAVGMEATPAGDAVYVRDNGPGFDMAFAQQVFSPFVRLHGADEFTGTGIGLAVARRVVDRHGGRIWAQAQVGGGAKFLFTLPVAPTAADPR